MTGAAVEVVDNGVARALAQLRAGLDDLPAAWDTLGDRAVAAAKPFVPVLTGALVDTLKAEASAGALRVVVGGGPVDYARIIDEGLPSRGIVAAHFMDRVAERIEADAEGTVGLAIDRLIGRVGLN